MKKINLDKSKLLEKIEKPTRKKTSFEYDVELMSKVKAKLSKENKKTNQKLNVTDIITAALELYVES